MHPAKTQKPVFTLTALSIASFSFGLTMTVLSFAYARDLATLASVPLAIWSALCGQPSDSPTTLVLLVTMSTLAFVAGLALWVARMWHARRS